MINTLYYEKQTDNYYISTQTVTKINKQKIDSYLTKFIDNTITVKDLNFKNNKVVPPTAKFIAVSTNKGIVSIDENNFVNTLNKHGVIYKTLNKKNKK